MAETVLENNPYIDVNTSYNHSEKKLKWWVKLIIIFFTVVALLVVVVFGLFYLDDKKRYQSEEINTQEVMFNEISVGLDDTKETKKFSVNLKEQLINVMIENILKDQEDAKKNIQNIYVNFKNYSEIWIKINLKAAFFKTQINIKVQIEKDTSGKKDDWKLILNIKDIVIGRVNNFISLVTSIIQRAKIDQMLERILNNSNLHLSIDLDNQQITYLYNDLKKDIMSFIQSDGKKSESELGVYLELIEEFFDGNFVNFRSEANKYFSVEFNIEKFTENTIEERKYEYDYYTLVKSTIEKLYEKNKKLSEKINLLPIPYYLLHGYERLSSSDKTIIDSIDFSDVTDVVGENKAEYKGVQKLYQSKLLEDVIMQKLNASGGYMGNESKIENGEVFLSIKEDDFADNIRKKQYFLGYGNILHRIENDKLIYNFIAIKDFYCDIVENGINFYVVFSINGCDCNLIINTEYYLPSENEEIKDHYEFGLKIKDVYLGSYKIGNKMHNVFLDVLKSSLNNDSVMEVEYLSESDEYVIKYNIYNALDPNFIDKINQLEAEQNKILQTSFTNDSINFFVK